jgi:diacylglycerol kinase (ATP)
MLAAGPSEAELAIVPRGTGGDFVRSFGIPAGLEAAIHVATEGRKRLIDLGRVSYRSWAGGSSQSYFANVASVGMSGAVAKRTNEATRAPLGGKAAYLWSTVAVFARWRNGEIRVAVDDEIRGGLMYDVIVANCKYLAGGMKIAPDAEPDDGLFDVLLIGDVTKLDLMATLPKIYRGTHLPHPKAELLRGAVVSVESDEPLPIQLDGEQPGTTPVRFEVVPGAVTLRVPG